MASVYNYRLLQPTVQEIRVLHINQHRNVSDRTPMRCKLKHISLQDVPVEPFLAVSYCWGSSKKRVPLFVDGQNVTIPQTAAIAIQKLSKGSSYPLWIDAVCIDQNNLQEKSQQVNMMKEVYSMAISVSIWLGSAERSTADAIASIEKIHQQCLEAIGGLEHLNTHLYGIGGFKYSDAPLPDCDWPALQAFYAAQWFGRLWVIQEIGLAKDSTFFVGSFSIGALDGPQKVHTLLRRTGESWSRERVEHVPTCRSAAFEPAKANSQSRLQFSSRQDLWVAWSASRRDSFRCCC